MRIFPIIFIVAITAFVPFAYGQKAFDTCEKAHHTGDMISCLSKQYEKIASELNDIYSGIQTAQPSDEVEAFRQVQNNWVSYRDAECAWEKIQAENESLQRVKELTCLIHLTEQREHTLAQFSQTLEEIKTPDEYMSGPRWANVILSTYPDIYWRYGSQISADLNCNGEDEEILLGKMLENAKDDEQLLVKPTLVVATNPKTGKPETTLFSLNLASKSEGQACQNPISLDIITQKDQKSDQDDEQAQCAVEIDVKSKGCISQQIRWDGEAFIIKNPAAEAQLQ